MPLSSDRVITCPPTALRLLPTALSARRLKDPPEVISNTQSALLRDRGEREGADSKQQRAARRARFEDWLNQSKKSSKDRSAGGVSAGETIMQIRFARMPVRRRSRTEAEGTLETVLLDVSDRTEKSGGKEMKVFEAEQLARLGGHWFPPSWLHGTRVGMTSSERGLRVLQKIRCRRGGSKCLRFWSCQPRLSASAA